MELHRRAVACEFPPSLPLGWFFLQVPLSSRTSAPQPADARSSLEAWVVVLILRCHRSIRGLRFDDSCLRRQSMKARC